METNLDLKDHALRASAEKLMQAAADYWNEYRKATGGAAVAWVRNADGGMVILTCGEYQATLMRNIDVLKNQSEKLFDYAGNAHQVNKE